MYIFVIFNNLYEPYSLIPAFIIQISFINRLTSSMETCFLEKFEPIWKNKSEFSKHTLEILWINDSINYFVMIHIK